MKAIRQWGILVSAIAVVSCHREPTAPASAYHGLLQSEQSSYVAAPTGSGAGVYYAISVPVRYVNQGNAPIYIERCGGGSQPLFGVQPIGNDSVPVGSTDMVPAACAGAPALVVEAGSVRRDTLAVSVSWPLPASVRLFYLAHGHCEDTGSCGPLLPDSDRVSSTIQIRATP